MVWFHLRQSRILLESLLGLGRDWQLCLRDACEGAGLSPSAWEALHLLQREGAVPLQELAAGLRVTRSTISRLAEQLEKKGLARRVPDPDDRRVQRLETLPAGQEAHDRVLGELEHRLLALPAPRGGHPADPLPALDALAGALATLNRRFLPPNGDRP